MKLNPVLLSVIIPARNEFPNVVHTVFSVLHCLEADGFKPQDFEIIIINNCSDDYKYPKRGTGGTTDYIMPRGAFWNRIVRVLYDPIAGNHSARNKGAKIARGKYLFFSDAHMAYRPGFFKSILKTIDESNGLVHGCLQYLGAYPPVDSSGGYGYSLKLGEEIKGTWNNYKLADTWFYVPAQGHWGLGCLKSQFMRFHGYPEVHRTYGGGEFYTDIKWWMFGSSVVVDPQAIGYHLAAGRGYSYHHDDYIHNVLNIAFSLGMDDWRERAYINWLRNGRKEVLDRIMEEGEKECAEDREFIEKNRAMTFNELIVSRPWDALNDIRHGKHNSAMTIFHDTWLELLKSSSEDSQEAYKNSKHQQGLDRFIRENLSAFVYRR